MSSRVRVVWEPDTCQCKIEYYFDNEEFITAPRKCKLHNNLRNGNTFLQVVQSHNRNFNKKFGSRALTKLEEEEILDDKRIEYDRIKNLKGNSS